MTLFTYVHPKQTLNNNSVTIQHYFQTRDSARDEQHGAGAAHHVLQEHGRVQAAPHHHVPRRHLRGAVHTRAAARAHRRTGGLHQGTAVVHIEHRF